MQPSENGPPPLDEGTGLDDSVSLVVHEVIAEHPRALVRRGELRGPGGFQKHTIIKTVPSELLAGSVTRSELVTAISRAAQLSHPGIVQIYDTTIDGDSFSIVSEMVEGYTLQQVVERAMSRGIPLPTHAIVWILRSVADALMFARDAAIDAGAESVAHGHLHPNNIFIRSGGQTKLTDLGLATALGAQAFVPRASRLTGAYDFMAPEQISSWQIDERTDVFALGSLLYLLSLGEPPFTGRSDLEVCQAAARGLPQLPRERFPDYPVALELIIERSLAVNPDLRFQTVDEFRARLDAALEGDAAAASRASMAAILSILFPEGARSMSGRWQLPTAAPGAARGTMPPAIESEEREERQTWILGFVAVAIISIIFWLLVFPLL